MVTPRLPRNGASLFFIAGRGAPSIGRSYRKTPENTGKTKTVSLYGVAGRQRTPVASTFMKMLRAANWPQKTG
jgi:hypothetical protein